MLGVEGREFVYDEKTNETHVCAGKHVIIDVTKHAGSHHISTTDDPW